jgi:hypothetical protein
VGPEVFAAALADRRRLKREVVTAELALVWIRSLAESCRDRLANEDLPDALPEPPTGRRHHRRPVGRSAGGARGGSGMRERHDLPGPGPDTGAMTDRPRRHPDDRLVLSCNNCGFARWVTPNEHAAYDREAPAAACADCGHERGWHWFTPRELAWANGNLVAP